MKRELAGIAGEAKGQHTSRHLPGASDLGTNYTAPLTAALGYFELVSMPARRIQEMIIREKHDKNNSEYDDVVRRY